MSWTYTDQAGREIIRDGEAVEARTIEYLVTGGEGDEWLVQVTVNVPGNDGLLPGAQAALAKFAAELPGVEFHGITFWRVLDRATPPMDTRARGEKA